MKKNMMIISAIVLLLVVCVSLWQYNAFNSNKLEVLCKSSITAALEHFEKYQAEQDESSYTAGVAEFRTYMTTYLSLKDGHSDTDYIWCNILYGDMYLHPEKVKAHIPELLEALGYLAEDYDHPNGFNLINELNNQLKIE